MSEQSAESVAPDSPKPDGYLARQDLRIAQGYADDLEGLVRHLMWLLNECLPFVPHEDSLRDRIVGLLLVQAEQEALDRTWKSASALDELTRMAQEDGFYGEHNDGRDDASRP